MFIQIECPVHGMKVIILKWNLCTRMYNSDINSDINSINE